MRCRLNKCTTQRNKRKKKSKEPREDAKERGSLDERIEGEGLVWTPRKTKGWMDGWMDNGSSVRIGKEKEKTQM